LSNIALYTRHGVVMMLKAVTPEGWKGVVIAKLPNFTAAAPATKQDQCDNAQPVAHEQLLRVARCYT